MKKIITIALVLVVSISMVFAADVFDDFKADLEKNEAKGFAESLEGYKFCCIATFIVPKGAEYFENKYGHIVSSEIIYTGKYLRISNFNK